MMRRSPRVFLDTSVVFAAVLSPGGGARRLFHLAEAGLLTLIVGPNVLRECDEVVRRKAPSSLPGLAQLLAAGRVQTCPPPSDKQVADARSYVEYKPDAHVLAEAISAGADWLVTHDKAHFLKVSAETQLPFKIGTPGDLIRSVVDNHLAVYGNR